MAKRVNVRTHPSQLIFHEVESKILLELFPFAVILDHDMRMKGASEKIVETWVLQNQHRNPRSFWGSNLVDIFKLRRPKSIIFDWQTVIQLNLVIFELEMMRIDSKDDDELSCAVEAAQTGEDVMR